MASIVLLQPLALFSSVVSDRFALQAEMDGTDLLLAIDTDLPLSGVFLVLVFVVRSELLFGLQNRIQLGRR